MDQRDIEQLLKAGEITSTIKSGDIFLLARPNAQRGDQYSVLVIKEEDFLSSLGLDGVLKVSKVVLTSAQMRTLNSAPIKVVDAPGVGKVVNIVSAFFNYNFGGIVFNFPADLVLITDGLGLGQFTDNFSIAAPRSVFAHFTPADLGAVTNSMAENKAVYLQANTGDATTGNGTYSLYALYTVNTL